MLRIYDYLQEEKDKLDEQWNNKVKFNLSYKEFVEFDELRNKLPTNLKEFSAFNYCCNSYEKHEQYFKDNIEENNPYYKNVNLKDVILYDIKADFFPNSITHLILSNNDLREIISLPSNLELLNVDDNIRLEYFPKLPNSLKTLYFSNTNIRDINPFPQNLKITQFSTWKSILDLSIFPDSLEILDLNKNLDIQSIIVSNKIPKNLLKNKIIYLAFNYNLLEVCSEILDFKYSKYSEETIKDYLTINRDYITKLTSITEKPFIYRCRDCKYILCEHSKNLYYTSLLQGYGKELYFKTKSKELLCEFCYNTTDDNNDFKSCILTLHSHHYDTFKCDECNRTLELFEDLYHVNHNKLQYNLCKNCIYKKNLITSYGNKAYLPFRIEKSINGILLHEFLEKLDDFNPVYEDESNNESD